MTRKFLYYPEFEPSQAWLRASLLFFDGIVTIVPENERRSVSSATQELGAKIADAVTHVAPNDDDREAVDPHVFNWGAGFEAAQVEQDETTAALEIGTGPDGESSFPEFSFLSQDKLSQGILDDLKARGCVLHETEDKQGRRRVVVPTSVAHIFMSALADQVASRADLQLPTMTERQSQFAFTRLQRQPRGTIQRALIQRYDVLSSTLRCAIPAEVAHVSVDRFEDIRVAYEDLRQPFFAVVSALESFHQIESATEWEEYRGRVDAAGRAFAQEVEKFHRSRFARAFGTWTPFALGTLMSVATAAVAGGPQVLTIPAVPVASAMVGALLQGLDHAGVFDAGREVGEATSTHKRLAELRTEILDAARLRPFLDR